MAKPILEIKNVSKKFRINHEASPYLSLRDSFSSLFSSGKKTTEDFYALNDVSFEVERGETIGIIGKNGAGKSTLLKILSKITPPTSGKITCRGRMASLLEVGTGFHPELTGRENIFFNGSILGMKRKEILRNFDAIVDFAGVEKFLDTPLKHYSSGMQLRLAFSVAAFLENEILIIDEVLAVGDAEFQNKCLGKMSEVSESGKTILFVSHNMAALLNLCKKGVLLHQGKLISEKGDIESVVNTYNGIFKSDKALLAGERNYFSNEFIAFNNIYFNDEKRFIALKNTSSLDLFVDFDLKEAAPHLEIGYRLLSNDGQLLYVSYFHDVSAGNWPRILKGRNLLKTSIPVNIFNVGTYTVEIIAALRNTYDFFNPGDYNTALTFEVVEPLSDSPYLLGKRKGYLSPILQWENIVTKASH